MNGELVIANKRVVDLFSQDAGFSQPQGLAPESTVIDQLVVPNAQGREGGFFL